MYCRETEIEAATSRYAKTSRTRSKQIISQEKLYNKQKEI